MLATVIIAAVLLLFAVPLGLTILSVWTARPPVFRKRADGHANEWAARKAAANRR